MKKISFFGVVTVAALSLGVSVEPYGPTWKTFTESDVTVAVSQKVKLMVEGPRKGEPLFLTGAGVRQKKVVVAWANVYLAASYTNLPRGLDKANPIGSLKEAKVKALELTFLRDVDGDKIRTSFADALKENGLSANAAPFQQLFDQMKFEMKKGQKLTFLGVALPEGGERLYLQTPSGLITQDGKEFLVDFWKIWFGKPADSGLEKLQPLLLDASLSF